MIETAFVGNLLAYSAQVALVTAAGALAIWALRIDVPAVRYTYWRTLLALCLVLPLIQPWAPTVTSSLIDPGAVEGQAPASVDSAAPAPVATSPASASPWRLPRPSPFFVVLVLAVGVAVRLAWLAAGLWRLRRFRRSGSPAPDADIQELCRLIEVKADVRFVAGRGQPVTFGFVRPVVLLPDALRSLGPAVQRAIVAHELWHVRRRDWMWVVAEEMVCAAFWFHPAISWLVSRVRNAREEAIDELTILLTGARRPYLEALLAFADEPPLFAAAAFARRRHLFHRMVLISKEAVMSSQRVVASCAAMAAIVVCSGVYAVQAFPLQGRPTAPGQGQPAPPRDGGHVMEFVSYEESLKRAIAANPRDVQSHLKLVKLQQDRGALQEAESTLLQLRATVPNDKTVLGAIALFYARTGQFERSIATLEEIALLDPSDPARHHTIAVFYWEKAFRDHTLPADLKQQYIDAGIAASDKALALNAEYTEALVYKNILLRMKAEYVPAGTARERLIKEADALRARAMELNRSRQGTTVVMHDSTVAPPPPPPPPPPPGMRDVDGMPPVRVGGNIAAPVKVRDVRPEYPPIARAAGVRGVVIMEATIDTNGDIAEARVLRSIPLLDQAALDAVRQWRFTPTYLNGRAVPVIMTVTVDFAIP